MDALGPRLESSLGHCERHALLHMAPKWFDHWTTWAGHCTWYHSTTTPDTALPSQLIYWLYCCMTETGLMPMTHAPETGARKLASVSGASVIQSGAEFFWRQILESDRTRSISRQNLATTWSKYWFVIGQCSMLLLFSFVGVVNFVCIFDYWNYLAYSVYLTWVGRIAR